MDIDCGTRIFCYADNTWGRITGRVATSTWVVRWSDGTVNTLDHASALMFANFAIKYAKQDPDLLAGPPADDLIIPPKAIAPRKDYNYAITNNHEYVITLPSDSVAASVNGASLKTIHVNGADLFAKIERLTHERDEAIAMLVRVSSERRAETVSATVEVQIDDPIDDDAPWWPWKFRPPTKSG